MQLSDFTLFMFTQSTGSLGESWYRLAYISCPRVRKFSTIT